MIYETGHAALMTFDQSKLHCDLSKLCKLQPQRVRLFEKIKK
jgi:hypothetical protein